ncbi:MAG: ABC-F family ATP-binding cassette domain-containing protein [Bacteroidales bacterium]|nr:ABC-F family ATP-binding cassette domain-containing protein [Bacteroidales bacterium]
MNLLSVENLSKWYGDKLLFKKISFGIEKGQKIALIAKNGTGKSTLLHIIMGIEPSDEGSVTLRNDIQVSYLPQITDYDEERTILDFVLNANTPLINAVKNYENALETYGELPSSMHKKEMEIAVEQMDMMDAWNLESRIKEVLHRFNIQNVFLNINCLSGGERKKIALAQVLLSESDLLILDEPTNHLDIDMIEWLENYLSTANMTLLFVTHDRFFLNKICTGIVELDEGTLYRYKGKYAYFLEKKSERIANQFSEIERAKSVYRRELEWIHTSPQARTTKAKARINRFEEIKQKANQNCKPNNAEFAVKTERIGNKILEINNLYFKYDQNLILKDFSYVFKKGERCGIVGPNGSGKSTLLKLIMNELRPTAGRIVAGETIVFGYYGQEGLSDSYYGKRLIDIVKEHAEMIRMANGNYISASQFLNHFGFEFQNQYAYYEHLSGGQRRKFYLLLVLLKNPNFIILDEPTNDFDIETLNILEDFLLNFTGCLLIVSHDRWFMDKLVDHMFIFEGNGTIKDFYGNYSEYKKQKDLVEKGERLKKKEVKPKIEKINTTDNANKMTYKERKEFEALEEEIHDLEIKKQQLVENLSNPSDCAMDIEKVYKKYTAVCCQLEEKSHRWLELGEKE